MRKIVAKIINMLVMLLIILVIGVTSYEVATYVSGDEGIFRALVKGAMNDPSVISNELTALMNEIKLKNQPSQEDIDIGNNDNNNTLTQNESSSKPLYNEKNETGDIKVAKDEKEAPLDLPPNEIVFFRNIALENIKILNEERRNKGIPELKIHDTLMDIAHLKVDDMMVYNYYSHESPTIGYTTDLIANRISPTPMIASENLNLIKTRMMWYEEYSGSFSEDIKSMALKSHNSLMRSDSHRENMLDPKLVYVGVAAAGNIIEEDGEEYYIFKVAQVFIKP